MGNWSAFLTRSNHARTVQRLVLASLVVMALSTMGCAHPLLGRLDTYRAAKKRGDYDTAAKYLAVDARIWFEKKEGPGHPLRAKGGPYADWDRFFNAKSTRKNVRVTDHTVTYISRETNDYFRLLERVSTPARVTYYFDDDRRITGMLYAGLGHKRLPDRKEQFVKWADEHYPGEVHRLQPGGSLSPTLQNAKRWKQLLIEWRREAGLPPIE